MRVYAIALYKRCRLIKILNNYLLCNVRRDLVEDLNKDQKNRSVRLEIRMQERRACDSRVHVREKFRDSVDAQILGDVRACCENVAEICLDIRTIRNKMILKGKLSASTHRMANRFMMPYNTVHGVSEPGNQMRDSLLFFRITKLSDTKCGTKISSTSVCKTLTKVEKREVWFIYRDVCKYGYMI
ncbi:uncharacterized protein LOC112465613 isoform X2 [Temnothorax curvispinosus]|uniref:Uncharacterized protein LOC112465613 isoform X2 n=1 Tax=Temnothorax curvispinosus TaxID=300111 RepID=A0A6J1R496_9HYME|nr:uncharacterized protein LOC112465613 isoform X2 [Temnothorax curvispinosus]